MVLSAFQALALNRRKPVSCSSIESFYPPHMLDLEQFLDSKREAKSESHKIALKKL